MLAHRIVRPPLIALERKDVVSIRLVDLFRDGALATRRVDRDCRSLELQGVKQTRDCFDLVALVGAGNLADAQRHIVHPGTQ